MYLVRRDFKRYERGSVPVTDREKTLRMLALSRVMGDTISDFLFVENELRGRFLTGAAGVIGFYLCNLDICGGEIAQGIREIAEDLEKERETAFCTDPYSFYRKHRALAAISRAYFYDISDRDILYQISRDPHKKYSFSMCYPLWITCALKRCMSTFRVHYDGQDIYHYFRASFADPNHLHLWNDYILPADYEPEFAGQVGFAFEDNCLSKRAGGIRTNLMRQFAEENIEYQKNLAKRKRFRLV